MSLLHSLLDPVCSDAVATALAEAHQGAPVFIREQYEAFKKTNKQKIPSKKNIYIYMYVLRLFFCFTYSIFLYLFSLHCCCNTAHLDVLKCKVKICS